MSKIATENEAAWRLFKRLLTGAEQIFSHLIEIIAGFFISWTLLPESLKARASKLGAAAGKRIIEKLVAKKAGKAAVKRIVWELVQRAVKSNVYKKVATSLGASETAGSTGAGIPVMLLGIQGLIEKAAMASDRLKSAFPVLYHKLVPSDLHMAWFLVEPFVDELRRKLYAHLETMLAELLAGAKDGRVLIDAGPQPRTPINAGPRPRTPINAGPR